MRIKFTQALMIAVCFLFISGFFLNPSYSADINDKPLPNAAVLDFSYKNVSKDDADIITEYFQSQLAKTMKFNVLDRNNIDKILREHNLQRSGITDTETTVEIGKLLNAQYLFTGKFSKLGSSYILTVNMVNIKTGKIEKTETQTTDEETTFRKLYITTWVAYSFVGFGTGYELFWDGKRVGFEPEWSYDQAVKNLEWNRTNNSYYKVEGYYNGRKMP